MTTDVASRELVQLPTDALRAFRDRERAAYEAIRARATPFNLARGKPATEQGFIVDGVNFLIPADLDGKQLPPPGAPNLLLATGGTQLQKIVTDDGIYAWKLHVDWKESGAEMPTSVGCTGQSKELIE